MASGTLPTPEDASISVRRVLALLLRFSFRAEPTRTAFYLALTTVGTIAAAGQALFMKFLIDSIIAGSPGQVWLWVGLTASVVAFVQLLSLASVIVRLRVSERVQLLLDEELMNLTTGLPGLEHHERPEFADQLTRLREQRSRLIGALGFLVNAISTLVSAVASAGLLLSVHPVVALFPLASLVTLKFEGISERRRQAAWAATSERYRISSHLFELATTAGPAKELRVFGIGPEVVRRHGELSDELRLEMNRESHRASALNVLGWLIFSAAFVGSLVFLVREVVAGRSTPGDLLLLLALGARANTLAAGLVSQVRNTNQNVDVVKRYLWFLDYAAERHRAPGNLPAPGHLEHGIDFESVAFAYPGTQTEVLRDVNLHIPARATVALVGDNGAGKTTLVKLLCGFYSPDEGRILVDGIDLSEFDPEGFRRVMAAGFQDFVKFEFLAQEAVGVGELSLIGDPEAVEGALARAGATDVAADLPEGLQTQLGRSFEGGAELSGGQWQKLALGRAMMRVTPLLLVLDEPTAALDAETEHTLFERYSAAAQRAQSANGGITLLVSHRFSTVRMADLIAVVGDGTVLEVGSHEELMTLGGRYAELYSLQAKAYS